MATAIVKCKCTHEFQDKKYGPQHRVANTTAKGGGPTDDTIEVRCTVCKSTTRINKGQVRR